MAENNNSYCKTSTTTLIRFADQQLIGLVNIIINGSFKIILDGPFHCNTQ